MQVFETQVQTLLNGTQADLPAGGTITVNGVTMKQSDIVAKLTAVLQLYAALDEAKTSTAKAQTALKAALPEMKTFAADYRQALKAFFGKNSAFLPAFGIKAAQPTVRSAATVLLGQAKAAATRKARGTLGKKQKAAIKATGSPGLVLYDGNGQPISQAGNAPAASKPAAAVSATPVAVVNK